MAIFKISVTAFGLLFVCFIDNYINSASPPTSQDPIVYVTFTRWENRTFSPRVYYLLMQRYGLRNKLLDLKSEYNEYLTDKGVNLGNPSLVNIVFKSKPISENPVTGDEVVDDRTAIRIINPKKNFLNLRTKPPPIIIDTNDQLFNSSPVVFPNVTPNEDTQSKNFFADRIAYPGSSNRRTATLLGLNRLKQNTPELLPTVFETKTPLEQLTNGRFTDEDVVDTLSLTLDIIKYSDWEDRNAVLSPFSITNILALLFLGSNGTTYNELGKCLRPRNPFIQGNSTREIKFHSAFRNLLYFLNRGYTSEVALDVCNRVIVDKKYPIMPYFQKKAIEYYDAQSDIFDFGKQGRDVMKVVNNWVSYKTMGKIPSVIDIPPSPETTLALVNAVYFRGDWEIPFIPEITQRKPFYVSPTEIIDVSMMTNILTVPYLETEHFRVIGIPYKGREIGLFVMLPTNPGTKGLKQMESQMTPENMKKLSLMKLVQVTLQLPKMRLESDGHIKDILTKFGLNSMFDPKTADFSRMSDTPGLHVTSILHKAIFEMNEQGVSAAAVTVATGDRTLEDRPILFAVNRPFAFTIHNIKAKTVLFFGRVTRPLPLDSN